MKYFPICFYSDSFDLNWWIFTSILYYNYIKLSLCYYYIILSLCYYISVYYIISSLDLKQILTEYLASTVIIVSSNVSFGPSPRTRISFFLLSKCTDKLLSTSKITTFWPISPRGNKTSEHTTNLVPQSHQHF